MSRTDTARFLLRLPKGLYAALQRAAAESALSLNEYCIRRLATSGPIAANHASAADVVNRALAVAGDDVVGVIVYGSWARGSAGPGSDLDVLVVVDRKRELTRTLYADWDRAPLTWDGREVDPHFVHLPKTGQATGVWGEAAVDGILLFERELAVSAALAGVRRDIADGRLVRRTVHGQPYWVAA